MLTWIVIHIFGSSKFEIYARHMNYFALWHTFKWCDYPCRSIIICDTKTMQRSYECANKKVNKCLFWCWFWFWFWYTWKAFAHVSVWKDGKGESFYWEKSGPTNWSNLLEFAHKIYIAIDSIATISCLFLPILCELCAWHKSVFWIQFH